MAWLNEMEIDDLHEKISAHLPELAPYSQFLSDWRDVINANSDGWPYWRAGTKPADGLSDLVKQARDSLMHRAELPDEAQFKKALSPIKAFATKQGLKAPELSAYEPSLPGMR